MEPCNRPMAGKHSKPTIIHHGIVGWKENQLSSPYIYQKNQRRKGRSIRKTITEIIFLNTIHKVLHKNNYHIRVYTWLSPYTSFYTRAPHGVQ
ncbi:hypothetical protein QL285_026522 [Trifolium repens]|nr:hypothetical protein QL285_026522 [Trifolium repens]